MPTPRTQNGPAHRAQNFNHRYICATINTRKICIIVEREMQLAQARRLTKALPPPTSVTASSSLNKPCSTVMPSARRICTDKSASNAFSCLETCLSPSRQTEQHRKGEQRRPVRHHIILRRGVDQGLDDELYTYIIFISSKDNADLNTKDAGLAGLPSGIMWLPSRSLNRNRKVLVELPARPLRSICKP